MSKILELVDIGRFLVLKLTCDGNSYEIIDVKFVKLDVATNPHTNLVGVRRNRQCQGLGTHLHRLNAAMITDWSSLQITSLAKPSVHQLGSQV